jgi:hypothetical protein
VRFPQTATITNQTAGGNDSHNRPTPTTSTITSPCLLQWQSSQEFLDNRDFTTTRGILFLPAGTQVFATSSVAVDGKTLQVIGEPNQLQDLQGRARHIEVVVESVTS